MNPGMHPGHGAIHRRCFSRTRQLNFVRSDFPRFSMWESHVETEVFGKMPTKNNPLPKNNTPFSWEKVNNRKHHIFCHSQGKKNGTPQKFADLPLDLGAWKFWEPNGSNKTEKSRGVGSLTSTRVFSTKNFFKKASKFLSLQNSDKKHLKNSRLLEPQKDTPNWKGKSSEPNLDFWVQHVNFEGCNSKYLAAVSSYHPAENLPSAAWKLNLAVQVDKVILKGLTQPFHIWSWVWVKKHHGDRQPTPLMYPYPPQPTPPSIPPQK